jgi:hypothetical protein
VPQNVETVWARDLDTLNNIALLRLMRQITQFTVDTHRNYRLIAEQFEAGVRCSKRDALGHGHSSIVHTQPSDKPL